MSILIERESSADPVASADIARKETKRVIFMAGDAIPDAEKFEMPDVKGFGGIYMPHIRTLPKVKGKSGARGMIPQCKFTSLQPQMTPEWEVMLPPGERKHYPASFVDKDGAETQNVTGFLGSDADALRRGEFKQERQGDIRYKKWYPASDVLRATRRNMPNGVGGVVEIQALAGASAAEIDKAQHYFFPQWDEIRTGTGKLPKTIREIEEQIRGRLADIPNQLWDEAKKAKYQSIGADMIKSCTQFRQSALEIIEKDDVIKQDAAKNGVTAPHSRISEHLLPQIEYKRKGDLLAGDSSAVNELAREMRADRESKNDALRLEQENKAKELELRERELALREAQLKSQVVTDTASVIEGAEGEKGELESTATSPSATIFPTTKPEDSEK